jgi:hypothetical protein
MADGATMLVCGGRDYTTGVVCAQRSTYCIVSAESLGSSLVAQGAPTRWQTNGPGLREWSACDDL